MTISLEHWQSVLEDIQRRFDIRDGEIVTAPWPGGFGVHFFSVRTGREYEARTVTDLRACIQWLTAEQKCRSKRPCQECRGWEMEDGHWGPCEPKEEESERREDGCPR